MEATLHYRLSVQIFQIDFPIILFDICRRSNENFSITQKGKREELNIYK